MVWLLSGFTVLILLVMVRAILGPTILDRLISINALTSMISIIILIIAFTQKKYEFVDIAIVFMLCGFVGSIWILKTLTPGDWDFQMGGCKGLQEEDEKEEKSVQSTNTAAVDGEEILDA